MDEAETLFDELAQLTSQYKNEVPGSRKAWPRSIKARVLKLASLDVRMGEIARRGKIPYYTVYNWAKPAERKKAQGRFHEIAVVPRSSEPAALPSPKSLQEFATVTVTMPNGCKIEGLPLEAALSWLERSHGGAR